MFVMVLVHVGGILALRSRRPWKLTRPAILRDTKEPQNGPTGTHTALRLSVPSSSLFQVKRGAVFFRMVDLLGIIAHGIIGSFVGGGIHFWSSTSCSTSLLKKVVVGERTLRRK